MFRILYLSPVSFIGGAEKSLCTLLKFLDRKKFESLVVLPGHGPLEKRLLKDKVRVEIIPWGNISKLLSRRRLFSLLILPLTLPEMFVLLIRLSRLIKKERIDLIHTNGLKCHFLGAVSAFWTRAKIVWHLRDIYNSCSLKIALRLTRTLSSAEVISISQAVKTGSGFSSSHVIYNGVDTSVYYPFSSSKDLREELGVAEGTKIITMPGVLTPWKGQHIFLEAIAELKNRFPHLIALIVGKELYTGIGHKGYLAYLKDMAKKLEIENQVRFLGFREDIPYIINFSLAIVHASLKPEPFGRVIIEAMACGKAVIAARGGAVEEIIRDGVDGLIVEKGDSSLLAQAIVTVLDNEAMAKDMGEKGRERVKELFSAEKMARKVGEFYLKVVHSYSRR